ncbi:DoxX family protein [Paenibacillus cremeus]|uniref:DoxX family protein n=1 Tax=Paenibacillus cremeus TaxID=2163881 RepID=A0A559KAM5_9BACL|nr:DoxX family protein [Paenibacillus cremeus]TVY09174.1 DoxX family protein [Paenibacillus cremeus]
MKSSISKGRLWTARVLSGLAVLFMLMDSIMKLFKPSFVVESTVALGYQEHHIVLIGILGLVSTILYVIPSTSILGAVVLTGYFGGVMATHIRLDAPLFSNILFPVYLAVMLWGSLWLRNEQVRRLFSFRN